MIEKKKLIPKPVQDNLQSAIYEELYASHLYKHLSNQMQRMGFKGAASYFRSEYANETSHYQKIADYLNDVGYVAELPEIDACEEEVFGLKNAIELAYNKEVDLMQKYNGWYDKSDPTTKQFLLEFIETQRKSVGELGDWIARLELIDDDECGLIIIDQELGAN